MSRAYYNEIEPAAAHVLRALIADGLIADGEVDTRSIAEVEPADLVGFTQCHFFAGGGLWSVAARLAGWPDERKLWSGSCPCQPWSVAGKGGGADDPRHLWPHFFRLIRACRPALVVGEQVAGAAGYGWFDGVRSDLAGEDYTCRGVDIPACAVDAPHIRQRLYWCAVADTDSGASQRQRGAGDLSRTASPPEGEGNQRQRQRDADFDNREGNGSLADASGGGHRGREEKPVGQPVERVASERSGSRDMGHAGGARLPTPEQQELRESGRREEGRATQQSGRNGSFWAGAEWRLGADGKARRVEPGLRLLADGVPGRVGLLRIAGNAIVPEIAAEVIRALMDAEARG